MPYRKRNEFLWLMYLKKPKMKTWRAMAKNPEGLFHANSTADAWFFDNETAAKEALNILQKKFPKVGFQLRKDYMSRLKVELPEKDKSKQNAMNLREALGRLLDGHVVYTMQMEPDGTTYAVYFKMNDLDVLQVQVGKGIWNPAVSLPVRGDFYDLDISGVSQ